MVDVVGLYSGIRPFKNSAEPTYFDLGTSGGQFRNKNNNMQDPAPRLNERIPNVSTQFNKILDIDTVRGVLPLKAEPQAVIYGRPDTSLTEHMYPKPGYARFQPKGLAINHQKPMDTPIPPIAGFYNPDAPNVLGGLKGS